MWDELREQIAVEREQLRHLIRTHYALLEKRRETPPTDVELSALAAALHSFYTGVENIFKRIALALDGGPPGGEFWHRELLNSMALPSRSRPAVISDPSRERLRGHLEFRHMFRHAYTFDLRWDKMSSLVLDCEATLKLVEAELEKFLEAFPPAQARPEGIQ